MKLCKRCGHEKHLHGELATVFTIGSYAIQVLLPGCRRDSCEGFKGEGIMLDKILVALGFFMVLLAVAALAVTLLVRLP